LRRPQFLASTLDIIAWVDRGENDPASRVKVVQVLWPKQGAESLVGQTLTIGNLPDCQGWTVPGDYILPLVKDGDNYRIAHIPPSPGFSPFSPENRPWIYPSTDETRAQFNTISKG
jgi:hypothetical protein